MVARSREPTLARKQAAPNGLSHQADIHSLRPEGLPERAEQEAGGWSGGGKDRAGRWRTPERPRIRVGFRGSHRSRGKGACPSYLGPGVSVGGGGGLFEAEVGDEALAALAAMIDPVFESYGLVPRVSRAMLQRVARRPSRRPERKPGRSVFGRSHRSLMKSSRRLLGSRLLGG